jgi:hypothetical protein
MIIACIYYQIPIAFYQNDQKAFVSKTLCGNLKEENLQFNEVQTRINGLSMSEQFLVIMQRNQIRNPEI